MPRVRWPKRGSRSYNPRKRARSINARIDYWPEVAEGPQILGFAGYKAGLTHVFIVEDREHVADFGKEVRNAVTILDTPPMSIFAVRGYADTNEGLKVLTEAWTESPPADLRRRIGHIPKTEPSKPLQALSQYDKVSEYRVLAATQPRLSSTPKKKPEIMEIKIGGGSMEEQLNYAKGLLGKEIKVSDIFKAGESIDVAGITKGKGVQGPVKRWGIRIRQNKSRKMKRGVGTLGPWHPARVMPGVPRAGQMGFHGRTEYGKRIIMLGSDGDRVSPKEGFVRYGLVNGDYVMIKGSLMGPPKRMIRLRKAARKPRYPEAAPQVTYIHTEYLKGAEAD